MNKRFEIIIKEASGEILHLGSDNSEKEENLQKLLNKRFKVYSCDIYGNPDYKRDLNQKTWKIKKRFDTIIAGEIIEHVRDPINFLNNCYKLLKNKGKIILTTPNATSIHYLFNPNWCVGSCKELCHIHTFTSGMIEVLLKNAGFSQIRIKYLSSYSKNYISILIGQIFPRLRGGIIAIGIKNEKT